MTRGAISPTEPLGGAVARPADGEWVAGVDEAGRGPLAGPVVAAAVILNPERPIAGLDDSKRLSPRQRDRLFDDIQAAALAVSVVAVDAATIDRINILQATLEAMRQAVDQLPIQPRCVLVDGNRLPVLNVPARAIVGGDASVEAISAASIIAKVTRDRWCLTAHAQWPEYGFDQHKGYPTASHVEALRRWGPCPVHRYSFGPVRAAVRGEVS